MKRHIQDYLNFKTVTLLKESKVLLQDDWRKEAQSQLSEIECLISYMSQHGDEEFKNLIKVVWD